MSCTKHLLDLTVEYFAAFNRKDLNAMAQLTHPDVVFVSPLGVRYEGKDAFLHLLQQRFLFFKTFEICTKFASGDQTVLTFKIEPIQPIDVVLGSVFLTFQDDLIIQIELYYDADPSFKIYE